MCSCVDLLLKHLCVVARAGMCHVQKEVGITTAYSLMAGSLKGEMQRQSVPHIVNQLLHKLKIKVLLAKQGNVNERELSAKASALKRTYQCVGRKHLSLSVWLYIEL